MPTLTHHLSIIRPANPARDEIERLLLDSAHALDERLFHDILAVGSYSATDIFAHHLVHIQHVQVDPAQL